MLPTTRLTWPAPLRRWPLLRTERHASPAGRQRCAPLPPQHYSADSACARAASRPAPCGRTLPRLRSLFAAVARLCGTAGDAALPREGNRGWCLPNPGGQSPTAFGVGGSRDHHKLAVNGF